MADIRCSHCGKDNPDFFDVCQYCQSPLKSESMLHTGEMPSAKDTGDLEPILPEWLQDARQQSRDSVDDDTFSPETKPKIQSVEPIDLLAGLAAQDESDEDEVPNWLASINPVGAEKSESQSEDETPSDFFAQFSQAEPQPSVPSKDEPSTSDAVSSLEDVKPKKPDREDELSGWFSESKTESSEPFAFDQGGSESEDNNWMSDLRSSETSEPESSVENEPEDLGWLHDLENASKKTGDLPSSQPDKGFDFVPVQSSSSDDDLSWLNDLGGTAMSQGEEPSIPSQPESSQEDLSWLNDLSRSQEPASGESIPIQPESTGEDLSWLNNLGSPSESPTDERTPLQADTSHEDMSWLDNLGQAQTSSDEESATPQMEISGDDLSWLNELGGTQASDEPAPSQPESSQNDMSWLGNLGSASSQEPEKPAFVQSESSQDDMSWLNNLGEENESALPEVQSPQFTPPGTAPLHENAGIDSTPDWLKNAMEEPTMPAPGDLSMEWFTEHEKSTDPDEKAEMQEMSDFQVDEPVASTQGETAPSSSGFVHPFDDLSATSSQDVDEMFNVDIPDWISQESMSTETLQPESPSIPASEDDTLSPVELPSWVQAMRPVDSAITETPATEDEEQEPESEGPLAGFRGVIPSAPIGSSLRPKAFSLKLQVTEEQQAGASLIEKIITGETTVHSVKLSAAVASQRTLRWILSGLFLIILGTVLGLGSQNFSIVAPASVSQLSDLVGTIPDGSPILFVVDYEPSVAGELTAAAGPVLDQLALARHAVFTFLSMSPTGSAMVEPLMSNTKIGASDGLGYQSGADYFNAGFLPGGSAGVRGFIDDPLKTMPKVVSLADVISFANFGAVVLMTDNAESGRVWVEQLEAAKQSQPEIASKPLILVSSAQSGPMLEPYVSSGQVDVLINGLSDAAKYEYVNQSRPGNARTYWDSFGIGLMLAALSIILGNVWNIVMGIRERRTEADQV